MSNTLRLQTSIISLEADSGDVALQQAMTRLPGLFNEAVTVFGKYVGAPLKALFVKQDFTQTVSKLQAMNYAELRTRDIFVPAGLQVDLLTYVTELEKACDLAATVKKAVLDPYNAWIGEKLGSPAQLKSVTAKISIPNFTPMQAKETAESLGKLFAPAGRQETVRAYGLAINRNADWNDVLCKVDTINNYFTEEQHKLILKAKDEAQSRLDTLVHRLQDNPEEYQMSAAALKTLASTTYDVASALEFYALMRYKVQELNVAFKDNETRLKQWF